MFAVYLGRAHVFRDAFTDRAGVQKALGRVLDAVQARDADSAERAAHDYLKKNGKALLDAAKRLG